jgi:acetyltransferase-like isoleucine patch superfamily enzyme
LLEAFILKIRRGETPFYRRLRNVAKRLRSSTLPLPRFLHPALRICFHAQQQMLVAARWLFSYFCREPLFRGRCVSVGKRFRLEVMPYVVGHTKIYIGNDVNFFGKVDISSGRMFDEPTLILKDRVDIGHGVSFVVNKQIVIEEDVNVAGGVAFMDSDAHPRDTMERIANLPPRLDEIKPVRVCRGAWIGRNSLILKGVTVGEGAIVGVNSVVVSDIPPYAVVMGNPARVVIKGAPKPAAQAGEKPIS